jgi:hypothetical protein
MFWIWIILSFVAGWYVGGAIAAIFYESKKKEKKPLFKTNDGVQMFMGDRYWYVGYCVDKKILQVCNALIKSEKDCCKGFCQFSTREKAEEQLCIYSDDRDNGEE